MGRKEQGACRVGLVTPAATSDVVVVAEDAGPIGGPGVMRRPRKTARTFAFAFAVAFAMVGRCRFRYRLFVRRAFVREGATPRSPTWFAAMVPRQRRRRRRRSQPISSQKLLISRRMTLANTFASRSTTAGRSAIASGRSRANGFERERTGSEATVCHERDVFRSRCLAQARTQGEGECKERAKTPNPTAPRIESGMLAQSKRLEPK
jgi:hypothetical protein